MESDCSELSGDVCLVTVFLCQRRERGMLQPADRARERERGRNLPTSGFDTYKNNQEVQTNS